MASKFSFENAAFHFAKTDGERGFLLPFLATYVVLGAVVYGIIAYLMMPLFGVYGELINLAMAGASEAEVERVIEARMMEVMGSMILGGLGATLLGVMFYVAMEGAIQRRYVRDEGFSLRFGGDELRLLLVMLVLYLMMFVFLFVFSLVIGLLMALIIGALGSEGAAIGVTMLLPLFFYAALLYFSIKFAPAAAMTVRDREFRFFGAWNVTKGRWWAMFGSYVVLYLILAVISFIVYFIAAFALFGTFMGAGGAQLGSDPGPAEIMAVLTQPAMAIIGIIMLVVVMAYAGFCQYAWAGVAAMAAKDDPKRGGGPNAASVFE